MLHDFFFFADNVGANLSGALLADTLVQLNSLTTQDELKP